MPEHGDGRSPPLLTAEQIAALCRVSLRTVRRWIATGDLESIRLGGVRRVRPSALQHFLDRGTYP